ncbi:MFS transporter [Novosphingobium acidiphilum]|uniref:MFS transporter n=1 Tax=Novosphingobium acidiphilum TaxID=505248 RepID=UPI00041FD261|nr:MFS transporter [Novosphingobium acidiphilum]
MTFLRQRAIAVLAVTFFALLVSAGVRSAPSVLMVPLSLHFGWDRATISATSAVGIVLYGLVGPFAAALMMSFGIRRTMASGLLLMGLATLASQFMSQSWHYLLTWGVLSGLGSGAVASVLGAAVVARWFAKRQGLAMGVLSASTATGSLIFLPVLAWLTSTGAWLPVVRLVGAVCLVLVPLVLWLVPEHPGDVGARRFGEDHAPAAPAPVAARDALAFAFSALGRAVRVPMFWMLFGTFFVCGLTTNGLVGTHLIAFCGDHGIAPVAAAGLLSTMGLFDLVGTTASGWLTDRYDPRRLLVAYYGLRGISLIVLPFCNFGTASLAVFAVFYGLDWIATVPPTVALATRTFGAREAPVVFGWVNVGHQLGAATAAFGAGLVRQEFGSYNPAFVIAGIFGVVAAGLLIAQIASGPRYRLQPA